MWWEERSVLIAKVAPSSTLPATPTWMASSTASRFFEHRPKRKDRSDSIELWLTAHNQTCLEFLQPMPTGHEGRL